MTLRVDADRVAWNDHEFVGQRVSDLVYDALQHGKPQREYDGIGALQRAAVVDGDDGGFAERRCQPSRRLLVGAREPQGLAA